MPWTGASSSCRGTATLASACPPRERPLHGSAADDHRGGRVLGARRYRGRPSPEKPRGPKTSYDIYGLKLGEGEGPPAIWQIVQNGIRPSWSPYGQRLCFVSNRDGNLELFLVDIDGGNLRNLTGTKGTAPVCPGRRTAAASPLSATASEIARFASST